MGMQCVNSELRPDGSEGWDLQKPEVQTMLYRKADRLAYWLARQHRISDADALCAALEGLNRGFERYDMSRGKNWSFFESYIKGAVSRLAARRRRERLARARCARGQQ